MNISITQDEAKIIEAWIQHEKEDGVFAVEGTDDDYDFLAEVREVCNSLESKIQKARDKEMFKKVVRRMNSMNV